MKKRIHAFVSGDVQGVFYRSTTKDWADREGLSGMVRNLSDGRVEVVAEGDESPLKTFIEFLWEGSSAARVESVDVTWEECRGEDGFKVESSV